MSKNETGSTIGVSFRLPKYLDKGVRDTAKRNGVGYAALCRYFVDMGMGIIDGCDKTPEEIATIIKIREAKLSVNQARENEKALLKENAMAIGDEMTGDLDA